MKYKDIAGRKNGRLTAIRFVGASPRGYAIWECLCECGNVKNVEGRSLNGAYGTRSCGCLLLDSAKLRPIRNSTNITHGDSGTKIRQRAGEYTVWHSMHQRCKNQNHMSYKNYGAKGIKVIDRWSNYENFLADMGRRPTPKHTLDRIDSNGDYCLSNCRWASWVDQQNNRSDNRMAVVNGVKYTAAQAARVCNIPHRTVINWLNKISPSLDISELVAKRHLGQESRNSFTSPAARSASDATSTSRLVHSLKTSESAAE